MQGEGYRLTQRRACHRVRHAGRQRNQDYAVTLGGLAFCLADTSTTIASVATTLAGWPSAGCRVGRRRGQHVDDITDPNEVDQRAVGQV